MTLSYDDLRDGRGADLGTSRWITVAQDRIGAFADVSEDHSWMHVDTERAAGGMFGGTIAHGMLTASLVVTLLGEVMRLDDDLMMTVLGMDRMRFTSPVRPGDRIRTHAVVDDVAETERGLRLSVTTTGELHGQERPAFVATTVMLITRD